MIKVCEICEKKSNIRVCNECQERKERMRKEIDRILSLKKR